MLYNYLKIAIRNLRKHPFISFINLFGLTVGLSCCLLILGYILHELSYDRFHSKADRIFRVERTFINTDTGMPSLELGCIAPPFGPLLENDFDDICQLTRVLFYGTSTLRYEDKLINEKNVFVADENISRVFDLEMVMGDAATALRDPFSMIMTEEMAHKYFGEENPIGKSVRMENQFEVKVTGVYKAFPANSHMHPQIMLSFNTLKIPEIYGEEALQTDWGGNNFFTYVLLREGYDPDKLETQFPAFLDRHLPSGGSTVKASSWNKLNLRALTDIHLYSQKDQEIEQNSDIKRVYIFSAIALFILLIACINYMNLSTARSVLRAKEIGVRKVVGAGKGELVLQFLSESVLIAWIATLLAAACAGIAFPWLNQLTDLDLSIELLMRWQVVLALLLVPFGVGVLSGIYPAIFLSSFKPVKVLKGFAKVGGGGLSFRQALVVAQFSISIILIISTLVVYQQLQYIQNKSLGYDREHIVTFSNTATMAGIYESFRNELLSSPHVKEVAQSTRIPTGRLLDGQGSQLNRGDSLAPVRANIRYVRTDDHFLAAYNIPLVSGRAFSSDYGQDTSSFIINEAAVKELGLPTAEAAVGKEFMYGNRKGRLVGVMQDFHFESMHQRIMPMVIYKSVGDEKYTRISVKLSGENLAAGLAHLEKSWHSFDPDTPLEYTFLTDRFQQLYQSEQRQGIIFTVFACIAIAIACLGLFGLSAFTIGQRVKEIGIRKVLGAETSGIVAMLSKDFLKLVVLAALIAFPVAWWAMHSWLEDFAYRVDIPLWVFLLAGIAALMVAFLTVSYQAIKAARANPVKNLRTE